MKHLFFMGGPLFMGILTILLITMSAWIIYHFFVAYSGKKEMSIETALRRLGYGKSIGLFALVTGFLGQLIGMSHALTDVAHMGSVAPGVLAAGIGVSVICAIFGIFIYLFSLLLWFIASNILERKLK